MPRKIDLCILICVWPLEYRVYVMEQVCSLGMTWYFTASDSHEANFGGANVRTKIVPLSRFDQKWFEYTFQWLRHPRITRCHVMTNMVPQVTNLVHVCTYWALLATTTSWLSCLQLEVTTHTSSLV